MTSSPPNPHQEAEAMQNSRENYKKDADHARVCPPRNPRLLFISASYFTSFNSSINRGHFPHLSIIYST